MSIPVATVEVGVIEGVRSAIRGSCLLDGGDGFFDSISFNGFSEGRLLESVTTNLLTDQNRSIYLSVMNDANQRSQPAFTHEDFEHATAELKFALRPDVHPISEEQRFLRVDGWLVEVERQACGVIGLAVFRNAQSGCWITWYATRPGGLRLGSHLMALAMSIAKSRGFKTLCVWTGDNATDAVRRYESFGFSRIECPPPDVPEGITNFVALERSLEDAREISPVNLLLNPDV